MASKKAEKKDKAGVVPCRINKKGQVELLLITARVNPNTWIFPVGTVDPGESKREAAARECAEESGYKVVTGPKITKLDIPRNGRTDHFTFYLAQVTGKAQSYEKDRKRKWVSPEEALNRVTPVFRQVAYTAVAKLAAHSGTWLKEWKE
ncbi:MAG: hypothetical protein Kow0080_06820 [Candidatus Promineifilaceae bacterium]